MKLRHLLQAGIALSPGLLGVGTGAARLLTVPATPFEESGGDYSLSQLGSIVVDSQHAETVDENGQTLIPPTLQQFAETVQEDLKSAIGIDLSLSTGPEPVDDSIFLTLENNTAFTDAAGRHTSEGYSLTVNDNGIVIAGASPLGAWWGTRSLIQAALVGDMSLPRGSGVDAPGWETRGAFLDAARHYFPPEFLIEMCSYMSFFKQNTFHVHLSDNVIFVADRYSREYALDNFYGAFRLWSDEPAVEGLNQRANESYTRSQFDEIQDKCARRGVTIVPEIEAPGHALVFTQWKPELGLEDPSMLNISMPKTIPTMQTVWQTFLPWFHSKNVHIGADEYESDEVEAYTTFVDQMNSFIREQAPRRVRLWGTFTPAQGCNVSREVSYQHWSHSFDNPYFDYIHNGYDVLNTDDAFYMVGKSQVSYPQTLNKTRVFHGDPATSGAYAPNIFDTNNATNNPPRDNPKVLGHLTALWNDYGPNATSVIEAYYGFRNILPALGDKQWGGDLTEDEYDSVFNKLHAAIPGQNLDRQIRSKSELILSYEFDEDTPDTVKDSSGNGYDGTLHGCEVKQSALHLSDGCYLSTPLGSKGRNYTLSFSVKPTSETPGTLFDGPDSILMNGNGTTNNVTMITGGNAYTLNYTLPLDTWTDVSLMGKGDHTYLQVSSDEADEPAKMEFKTIIGVVGRSMAWAHISIEAPVATIGKGFTGMMKNIQLQDG